MLWSAAQILKIFGSHFTIYRGGTEKSDLLCELLTVQAVQRQLEEVAEKQRDLEERGVAVEKSIRQEAGRGRPYSTASAPDFNDLFNSLLFFSPS